MIKTTELLIGGFWFATVSGTAWLLGVLAGYGLARLVAAGRARRSDVDELLRRQRAAMGTAPRPSPPAASGATTATARVE